MRGADAMKINTKPSDDAISAALKQSAVAMSIAVSDLMLVPYVERGIDPAVGLDCYGFVRVVLHRWCGGLLPESPVMAAVDPSIVIEVVLRGDDDVVRVGDLVRMVGPGGGEMAVPGVPGEHLGIVIDDGFLPVDRGGRGEVTVAHMTSAGGVQLVSLRMLERTGQVRSLCRVKRMGNGGQSA